MTHLMNLLIFQSLSTNPLSMRKPRPQRALQEKGTSLRILKSLFWSKSNSKFSNRQALKETRSINHLQLSNAWVPQIYFEIRNEMRLRWVHFYYNKRPNSPDCGLHNCHPSEQSKSTQQFKVKETKNIINLNLYNMGYS